MLVVEMPWSRFLVQEGSDLNAIQWSQHSAAAAALAAGALLTILQRCRAIHRGAVEQCLKALCFQFGPNLVQGGICIEFRAM